MNKTVFITGFFLLTAFFTSGFLYAQAQSTTRIDSLEKRLQELHDDSNKVKTYSQLGKEWSAVKPRKGIESSLLGLALAKKIDWKKGIAVNYIAIGYGYGVLGIYDTALFYNDSAIAAALVTNDKSRIALTYINRASTLLEQKKLSDAQKDFLDAIKFAEESGNADRVARSYMGLGNVFYYQGNYEKAKVNYASGLLIFDSLENSAMVSISEMNMGNCARQMKKYDEAHEHYTKAIQIQEKNNDLASLTTTYSVAAMLEEERNDSAKAIYYYELAFDLAKQLDDKEMLAMNGALIGSYYISKKDFKKGMMFLEEAYKSAGESNLTEEKFNAASSLAKAY